jgi:hypothetical protein
MLFKGEIINEDAEKFIIVLECLFMGVSGKSMNYRCFAPEQVSSCALFLEITAQKTLKDLESENAGEDIKLALQ